MSMRTFAVQAGRTPKFAGPCAKCGGNVDPKRDWEAILLRAAKRGDLPEEWAVAHAGCIGGKYGGVKKKWRGPETVKLPV